MLMQTADDTATNGTVGQPITYEKIPTQIFADSKEASTAVALEIADLIRKKQKEGKMCVLGLATGSSPKTVYAKL
ncbi:MAG TPA: glucosamine-6-phosphate deaminase, partial [Dyadobacter sp.]|nr:glucosamine-6-phosphate deaminase [Dyadobacter sp.]